MRQDGYYFYKKRKRYSGEGFRELLYWLIGIFVSILLAFVLTYFFGMSTEMCGDSMEPAITDGQRVLVNRFVYKVSQPKPGDVVLFLPNGNTNTNYSVKRVVAVPGDRVYINGGVLYVNDSPSEYVNGRIADPGMASSEITIGQGEFFVMSDDTLGFDDSRNANIGPVESKYILGKVWIALSEGDSKMHPL